MAKAILIYNGYYCEILKVWDGGYYDLQTIEKTKKGIIEQYLSVHISELRAQGNVL
jgi:hypothetical protein